MSDSIFEEDVKKYGKEKAEQIRELQSIIYAELQKDEAEMNKDLIDECVDWCLELKGEEAEASADELNAVYDKCASEKNLPNKLQENSPSTPPVRSVKRTLTAILAAVLVTAAISITVTGTWDFLEPGYTMSEFYELSPGEVWSTSDADYVGITGYDYDTVEEFYAAVGTNFLHPKGLNSTNVFHGLAETGYTVNEVVIYYEGDIIVSVHFIKPPNTEERLIEEGLKQYKINGRTYYHYARPQAGYVTLDMFVGSIGYTIQARTLEKALEVAAMLEYFDE